MRKHHFKRKQYIDKNTFADTTKFGVGGYLVCYSCGWKTSYENWKENEIDRCEKCNGILKREW